MQLIAVRARLSLDDGAQPWGSLEVHSGKPTAISRRGLIKIGTAAALLVGSAPAIVPNRARARQKTLRILQWKHFVPGYDQWFNGEYTTAWGERNDIDVIVDNVGLGEIEGVVANEAANQQGHDLVMLLAPPAIYQDKIIDHGEIYTECERHYGNVANFAVKSTYNPATDKYFGFCTAYLPAVMTYRRDLWNGVGAALDTWDDILTGGRRIKLLQERSVGLSLAPEHNSEHTMRAILYSFGASVQDARGNPALQSKEALDAVKFVKALYEETMTREVLTWDATSNNRFMLTGDGSVTLDTMSIVRASENKQLEVAKDLWLAKAPEGPTGRYAPSFGILTYFIWNFAENADAAKRFLVDYAGQARRALLASGFQNMPTFSDAVPDLAHVVANDASATPPDKYALLADGATWTTNLGHPGYTSAAIGEVYKRGVIPRMFAQAATGASTPAEALEAADLEVRRIFDERRQGD